MRSNARAGSLWDDHWPSESAFSVFIASSDEFMMPDRMDSYTVVEEGIGESYDQLCNSVFNAIQWQTDGIRR